MCHPNPSICPRQQVRSEEQEALWRLAAEASVAEQRVRSRAKLKRKLPVAWEKGFAAGKEADRLEREQYSRASSAGSCPRSEGTIGGSAQPRSARQSGGWAGSPGSPE